MKRVLLTLLIAMAVVGLVVGAVLAYTSTITNNYTVIEANTNISVWAEQGCVTPVSALDWGQLRQAGPASSKTMWVRNDGDVSVDINIAASGLATGMTLTCPSSLGDVAVDEVVELDMSLAASASAAVGAGSFSINLDSAS